MQAQNEFYINQLKPLVGAKVKSIISDEEGEYFGLRFTTKEGKNMNMFILADDEGNGPGSFELTQDEEKNNGG